MLFFKAQTIPKNLFSNKTVVSTNEERILMNLQFPNITKQKCLRVTKLIK